MSIYGQQKPWASHEERLVTEALSSVADVPGELLAELAPPLPQIDRFRPRLGYGDRPAIGIHDIVRLEDLYGNARVDFSKSRSGYSGSSFPSLGVM